MRLIQSYSFLWEDVAVRFQLFDMYCLLQEQEAARPTSSMYFTQAFFYSCFQLVGRQAMAQALFLLIKIRIKHINPTTARKFYKYVYNLFAGREAEWPKMSRSALTIVELVQVLQREVDIDPTPMTLKTGRSSRNSSCLFYIVVYKSMNANIC
jgi:hypothetical protein